MLLQMELHILLNTMGTYFNFRSNGDGTFAGRQFDFNTGVPGHDYDAKGNMGCRELPCDGR